MADEVKQVPMIALDLFAVSARQTAWAHEQVIAGLEDQVAELEYLLDRALEREALAEMRITWLLGRDYDA